MRKCSLIIPRAKEGKFIISKRAKEKRPYPGVWVCAVGGKVEPNESFDEAAKREMMEEIGIEHPLTYVASFKYEAEIQLEFAIYTTETPLNPELFTLDKSEIQFMKEIEMDELLKEIENKPEDFAPTFRKAFQVFAKEMKK